MTISVYLRTIVNLDGRRPIYSDELLYYGDDRQKAQLTIDDYAGFENPVRFIVWEENKSVHS